MTSPCPSRTFPAAFAISSTSSRTQEDLPEFSQLDGFKGFTLFVDRSNGECMGISYWASAEQLTASEEQVRGARQRAAETGGATGEPQVERLEVALDTFMP